MGTRSLTRVIADGKHIMNMYRQFDGYPSGHGAELAALIKGKAIVNGYSHKGQQAFNGAGCLAASVVAEFKDGIGGIYLYPVESTNCGQDYEYHLIVDSERQTLRVKVDGCRGTEFDGTPEEFAEWCVKEEDEE